MAGRQWASASQAFGVRFGEYPLEFLYASRNSYLELSQLLAGITVIPPMGLEQAKAEVVTRMLRQRPTHRQR
jgi:hypothetical protein